VVVADPQSGLIVDTIAAGGARSNFPMALDEDAKRLLVAFRDPPVLRLMALDDKRFNDVETCRDADDVFVDHRRRRIYVICGQGVVDVLKDDGSRIDRIATSPGARTGLFVPELDRLFVAVPAHGSTTAGIQVLRPSQLESK
jgi:hypothetical protein